MSTSTRNFPNRLGKNTNVFLGSAELSAEVGIVAKNAASIYKYMNFDQIAEYAETAKA